MALNEKNQHIFNELMEELEDLRKNPLIKEEENISEFNIIKDKFIQNDLPFKMTWEDFKNTMNGYEQVFEQNIEEDYDSSYESSYEDYEDYDDYDYDSSYESSYDDED